LKEERQTKDFELTEILNQIRERRDATNYPLKKSPFQFWSDRFGRKSVAYNEKIRENPFFMALKVWICCLNEINYK
jgi:hypothetical protein